MPPVTLGSASRPTRRRLIEPRRLMMVSSRGGSDAGEGRQRGQADVDQAAWRAAQAAGIRPVGWTPFGFETESGPRPDFESHHGVRKHARTDDPPWYRPRPNVRDSDGTSIIRDEGEITPWTALMVLTRRDVGKPSLVMAVDGPRWLRCRPGGVAGWIRCREIRVLNVSGPRASWAPGLGGLAEQYLPELFAHLRRGMTDTARPHMTGPTDTSVDGRRPWSSS